MLGDGGDYAALGLSEGSGAHSRRDSALPLGQFPALGQAVARQVDGVTWRLWGLWTGVVWGGVALCAVLFYVGVLSFRDSTRVALYGISVWLNGWMIPLVRHSKWWWNRWPGTGGSEGRRSRSEVWHECLVLWLVSYTMTNVLWEIPWVLTSPFAFHDLTDVQQVVARTDWMRESPLHMGWWMVASFSSVDMRTVNHNGTFYALEFFSFMNVAAAVMFLRLNRQNSPLRYLVPVLGSGEPFAATFIFSMSEVFDRYKDMSGGTADTLLALVWTQYQYFVFPAIFGYIGVKLLLEDLHVGWFRAARKPEAYVA